MEVNRITELLKTNEAKPFHGSTISFNSINYSIDIDESCLPCLNIGCQQKSRQILHDLNGIFRPGVNAILGPTGSGKSSLLDILAARKDRRGLSGEVLMDGQQLTQNYKYRVGYVVQDDILSGMLSVRENLTFSASVRLPRNVTSTEKESIVERVITQLGLEKCADSRVGTEDSRGISGGERRRTNIGMELVLSPTVLFLDEPTTGLDSSTALSVMECLEQLSNKGHTIILSIHQPRYSIFKQFNNLFLIASGHCIYHGPASDVLDYFAKIGLTREEQDNPADFILDIAQGLRWSPELMSQTNFNPENKKEQIAQFMHERYIKSSLHGSIIEQIGQIHRNSNEEMIKKPLSATRSLWTEMFYVSQRTLRCSFRNPTLMVMQTIVPVCMAILVGALYFNTDRTYDNGTKNRLGAVFFIVANQVFLNLSALELFIKERQLFLHEVASGYYTCKIYFICKLLCDILPLRSIPSVLFSLIAYFMIQFQRTTEKFLIFLLTIFLTSVCSASICFCISASVESFAIANLVAAAFCVVMLVFTGYLLDVGTALPFLSWIKWASIFRYASDALSYNEFTNLTLCASNITKTCTIKGEEVLVKQKIDHTTSWHLHRNFFAMTIMTFGFFALTFVQLVRFQRRKR